MQLLERAKANKLAADLSQAAAFALQTSAFEEFKPDITTLYPLPPSRNEEPLPPLCSSSRARGTLTRGR